MAARLGLLTRRAVVPRALMPVRGGGGGPVASGRPPVQPLAEEDELVWDDGSAQPEPCLDEFDLVTKKALSVQYQALGYLAGGFALFGLIGLAARWNNKAAKQPFAPKQFPYDNLKMELGSRS